MFSLAIRRSAVMARPRIGAALSTQTSAQIHALEDLLQNIHLHDLKDNVEEIFHLLEEPKTNHSLQKDPVFENYVTKELQGIQDMIAESSTPNVAGIKDRVSGLKKHVRSQVYHTA